MAIESIKSPMVPQTATEPVSEGAGASAAMLESLPLEAAAFQSGLETFSSFALQAMSFSPMATVDPGNDLITFSSLEDAKKWAGSEVDTVYFKKYVEGGVTYLIPLKAVRPKDVDLSNMYTNKLQFVVAGTPVLFLQNIPPAREFLRLNSADQMALVSLLGTPQTVSYPPPKTGSISYISITFPGQGSEPSTTAVLSQNAKKVYIVEKLQARDFAVMSYDDQFAISKTAAFDAAKKTLGLTGTTTEAIAAIDKAIAAIKVAFPDDILSSTSEDVKTTVFQTANGITHINDWQRSNITYDNKIQAKVNLEGQIGIFTKDQRDLFLKQMEIIRDEALNDMAVFNMAAISDKLKSISDRFERALAFGNLPVMDSGDHQDTAGATQKVEIVAGFAIIVDGHFFTPKIYTKYSRFRGHTNLISLDDNKTVREGFELFIAQEKKYYENAQSRRDLVKNVTQNNLTIDAPSLLYRLQIHYNISSDADISCSSEELRQQNDLLNIYSKASQLLSTTVGLNKDTTFLGITESHSQDQRWNGPEDVRGQGTEQLIEISYLNPTDLKVMSLFQNNNGYPGVRAPLHPLEKLRKITRPRIDLVGGDGNGLHGSGWLQQRKVSEWQQTSNQFSETSNLIGQETQNSVNKISGFEKDKARYTDIASNTLSKLNEVIIAIGRSL